MTRFLLQQSAEEVTQLHPTAAYNTDLFQHIKVNLDKQVAIKWLTLQVY